MALAAVLGAVAAWVIGNRSAPQPRVVYAEETASEQNRLPWEEPWPQGYELWRVLVRNKGPVPARDLRVLVHDEGTSRTPTITPAGLQPTLAREGEWLIVTIPTLLRGDEVDIQGLRRIGTGYLGARVAHASGAASMDADILSEPSTTLERVARATRFVLMWPYDVLVVAPLVRIGFNPFDLGYDVSHWPAWKQELVGYLLVPVFWPGWWPMVFYAAFDAAIILALVGLFFLVMRAIRRKGRRSEPAKKMLLGTWGVPGGDGAAEARRPRRRKNGPSRGA